MQLLNNPDLSENIKKSQQTEGHIRDIASAITVTRDKYFPEMRLPIIAGGAIRDVVFGTHPRDYDVFLDVSYLPKDEQEDATLVMLSGILTELDKTGKYPSLTKSNMTQIGGIGGDSSIYEQDPSWKDFFVYENTPAVDEHFDAQIEEWHDPHEVRVVERPFLSIQTIGNNDKRLSLEDPTEFLEYFDWPLVRAMFDPAINKFRFHTDFIEQLDKKKIVVDNKRTYERVNRWLLRFEHGGKFEIVRNWTPQYANKYTVGPSWDLNTQTAITETYGDIVQRYLAPAAMANFIDLEMIALANIAGIDNAIPVPPGQEQVEVDPLNGL